MHTPLRPAFIAASNALCALPIERELSLELLRSIIEAAPEGEYWSEQEGHDFVDLHMTGR